VVRAERCYTLPYMVRLLLGTIKGGLIGAGLGYVATRLGVTGGVLAFVTYAAVGFVVGLVCGKALWRQETLWTPALKGLVGAALVTGIYWGATKLLGGFKLAFATQLGAPDRPLVNLPLVLAPILGIVYGIFVEIDDGEKKAAAAAGK
jgi:hypothetical protein